MSEGLRYLCHIICMLNKKQLRSHYYIFCIYVYGNYQLGTMGFVSLYCFFLENWCSDTAMLNSKENVGIVHYKLTEMKMT